MLILLALEANLCIHVDLHLPLGSKECRAPHAEAKLRLELQNDIFEARLEGYNIKIKNLEAQVNYLKQESLWLHETNKGLVTLANKIAQLNENGPEQWVASQSQVVAIAKGQKALEERVITMATTVNEGMARMMNTLSEWNVQLPNLEYPAAPESKTYKGEEQSFRRKASTISPGKYLNYFSTNSPSTPLGHKRLRCSYTPYNEDEEATAGPSAPRHVEEASTHPEAMGLQLPVWPSHTSSQMTSTNASVRIRVSQLRRGFVVPSLGADFSKCLVQFIEDRNKSNRDWKELR